MPKEGSLKDTRSEVTNKTKLYYTSFLRFCFGFVLDLRGGFPLI